MKKLLAILLLVSTLRANADLVTIPGGVTIPNYNGHRSTVGFVAFSMTATAHKIGKVFQISKTGTIDKLELVSKIPQRD